MKQQFTTLVIALCAMLTASAQSGGDYINMSYCSDDIQCSIALENGAPTKTAIAITRGMLGNYADAEIVGVRVGLSASATNVSGWIIEGNDPTKSNAEASPVYAYKERGWTDLIFRSPYTFSKSQGSNAAIIVGYTSTGTDQIGFDGSSDVNDNGNLMWTAARGWGSVAKTCREAGYGNACVQILLGGITLPTADMAITAVSTRHAEQGQPYTLRGTVVNKVPTPVTSYVMTYSIAGSAPTEVRMVQNVNNSAAADFTIDMPPFESVGPQDVTLTITSVNGEADAMPSDNLWQGTIESVEAGLYFPKVHVVEESTNTGCGFCPRGIVVMESMMERHPDSFIGIAVHSNVTSQSDPLYVASYFEPFAYDIADPVSMTISEPKGIMNRDAALCGDPLYWDLWYDAHENDLAPAGIFLRSVSDIREATAGEGRGSRLDVAYATRFDHDADDHDYSIAFVLVEDNVTGYSQTNYYSSGAYGQMGGWENQPSTVRTVFNNVARAIWDYDGLDGSVPAVVRRGVDNEGTVALDLTDVKWNIEGNLSIVALLLDGKSGHILQATSRPVGTIQEGIAPLRPDSTVGAALPAYDLAGRPAAAHGIVVQGTRKSIL